MKKQIPPKEIFPKSKKDTKQPIIEETPDQLVLRLIRSPEDKIYKSLSDKQLDNANLKFELLNNTSTSLFERWQAQKALTTEIKIHHEPRFKRFLELFGDLEHWTDEERRAYRKDIIVPITINATIYNRFPTEVKEHMHRRNPCYKWLIRKDKFYFYLGEGGILVLEKFLDDIESIMNEVKIKGGSIYDVRVIDAQRFGSGFQLNIFEEYFRSIC